MFKKFTEYPRKTMAAPRTKESKLLSCKCANTKKDYFLRIDKKIGEDSWHFAYAFPFHESLRGDSSVATKKEKINIGRDYPEWNGCPYCKQKVAIFCECGTIFCCKQIGDVVTCPGCNQTYSTYAASSFNTKTSSH